MSQSDSRIAEVEISMGKNLLQGKLLQGLLIILIPLTLAFAALIVVREPALQAQVGSELASVSASQRAEDIVRFNEALMSRIAAMGRLDSATRDQVSGSVLPEATSVTVVPLDDLGTVNLRPGDFQLASHIEIDLIRRAFNGENPPPEAVKRGDAWALIYARDYNNGADQGVVIAEVPIGVLAELLTETTQARYALLQRTSSTSTPVIGTAMEADAQTRVGNTEWLVGVQTKASWLSPLLSSLIWILGAGIACITGLLVGGGVILSGVPSLLRKEADRILESAENKTALSIQVPPLLPLARLLRQMALLSRRQLITAARKSSEAVETTEEETKAVAGAQPSTEVLAAEIEETEESLESLGDGIPAHIFRNGDIRGRTADELTEQLVERICRALAVIAGRRGVQTLAVAYDGRASSEKLRTTVVKTLLASGRDVVDLGQAPAPLLYFATHETEYDSGIMITGGHSDDDTNGLRIVLQRALLGSKGMQEIVDAMRDGVVDHGSGRTIKVDVEADYLDKIALDIGIALPLQIVIDSNFGAAAHLARETFTALGCDVTSYNNPDEGQRPGADWTLSDALHGLGERVRSDGADLGLLYDSDGDRLHTVTNEGTSVATDQLMMILARDLLERNPGADVVYDIQCTRHFAPFITRCGGRAVISRSGHASVHNKMLQANATLGGEYSGHIFMKDRWFGFDDGVYAAARLVELLSTSGDSYQDMLAALPQYVSSPEITVPLAATERRELFKALTAEPDFPGSRVTTLDGLRVDYSDSWGLVQSSSTEEALNFRFEGNDEQAVTRVKAVMRKAITEHLADIELPF